MNKIVITHDENGHAHYGICYLLAGRHVVSPVVSVEAAKALLAAIGQLADAKMIAEMEQAFASTNRRACDD